MFVDDKLNNVIDFAVKKMEIVKLVKVNYQHAVDSHLFPKKIDHSTDEFLLVRKNQDIDFNNFNLTNIISITLKTQAVNDNQVIFKYYVDQFHQENERSRRVSGIDFYNESSDLVKNKQYNSLMIINYLI